jgi:ferredoxin
LFESYFYLLLTVKIKESMAIIITDECINCGACEPECPNTAIYEGGMEWNWAGGTKLSTVTREDGTTEDATVNQKPVSDEFYYIVPGKCTECTGFHEEPQCAAVCPVDCCVPDPDHVESKEVLAARKAYLHQE